MKTYLDCVPCLLRQALEAARAATGDEDVHRGVLNSVAGLISQFSLHLTPPEIAQQIYRLIYQITRNSDPYREAKAKANQMGLALYPRVREAVASSDDPLLTACKLAIAGNSIDLAPPSGHSDLNSIVESALVTPLAIDDYEEFRTSIQRSAHVLYLGDNAGEIVFDKVLVEELRWTKADIEINFVVREKPIINDATWNDAIFVGLDKVAAIVSSGSDAPATILSQCSSEMLALYHSADTIIAKGQGNYESLSGEQGNIFFMLKAKCPIVAGLLEVSVGDAILMARARRRQNKGDRSGQRASAVHNTDRITNHSL